MCARLGLSKLSVPWDVDTRWNSTYRMFERCLPYKNAINESLNKSVEGMQLALTDEEWVQLEQLKEFLKVFFEATVKLSCSRTPSAHLLLHHLYTISKVSYIIYAHKIISPIFFSIKTYKIILINLCIFL